MVMIPVNLRNSISENLQKDKAQAKKYFHLAIGNVRKENIVFFSTGKSLEVLKKKHADGGEPILCYLVETIEPMGFHSLKQINRYFMMKLQMDNHESIEEDTYK